jgi:hypothetical protein
MVLAARPTWAIAREDGVGDRLVRGGGQQRAAGVDERQPGPVDLLAVAQAFALALLAHPQLQFAMQAIEVLERVVLTALDAHRGERDEGRQSPRVGHLGQITRSAGCRVDRQRPHAFDRQGLKPAESVGHGAQFAQALKRGDQAGGGRACR